MQIILATIFTLSSFAIPMTYGVVTPISWGCFHKLCYSDFTLWQGVTGFLTGVILKEFLPGGSLWKLIVLS